MRLVVPALFLLLSVTIGPTSGTDDAFNIELKQKDAEVYHEQSFGKNEFNYGYQVEKTNSQFQHKAKGPDDVTYGCYGYIDPVGEKHLVYYIADRLGYRLLAPDQPTKVFTERVANSVNKLDADLQGRKLDEKVVAWNDLYLPSTCRRLNEIVSITLPPTPIAPKSPTDGDFFKESNVPVKITTTTPTPSGGSALVSGQENINEDREHAAEVPVHPDGTNHDQGHSNDGGASYPGSNDAGTGVGGSNGADINEAPSTPHPVEETRTPEPPTAPQQVLPQTTYLPVASTNRPPVVRTPEQHPQSNCAHEGPFSPRPRYPAQVGQFNGFVFPINRNCDDSGRNTADLLAQMQSINELVLKVSDTLHSLVANDRNGTCQRVLELLNLQQPVPLLVYVPIMMPYLDGGLNGSAGSNTQRPPINPASYAYAKACSECK